MKNVLSCIDLACEIIKTNFPNGFKDSKEEFQRFINKLAGSNPLKIIALLNMLQNPENIDRFIIAKQMDLIQKHLSCLIDILSSYGLGFESNLEMNSTENILKVLADIQPKIPDAMRSMERTLSRLNPNYRDNKYFQESKTLTLQDMIDINQHIKELEKERTFQ